MGKIKQHDRFFLTSKVARRIFLMFVFCAILPLLTISAVSFFFVGHQLREQAEKRLHQQSKNLGLLTYERLLALEEDLKSMAHDYKAGRGRIGQPEPFNPLTREGNGFERVFVRMPDGRAVDIVDHLMTTADRPWPETGPPQNQQTIISLAQDHERFPHIYMLRYVDADQSDLGVIAGEINPLYLWGIGTEGALPPGIDMSVVMDASKILISSIPAYKIDAEYLEARKQASFTGTYANRHGGRAYLNSYWSLFLAHRFSSPEWTFIFSESKSSIMAPVSNFKFIFFLLVLLTFWVILLLSLRAIRNRTVPIEKLKEGAMQIAAGRFGFQIDIASGDEFESLAQTFNEMSAKLKQSQEMLLQAAKMSTFGQMGAGIVHEIGQPLSAISGYAELLQMGASPDKQQHFLNTIVQETHRLKEIVGKFRTFTRVSEEVFRPTDINSVLNTTLNLLDHQFIINNVTLEQSRQDDLPGIIGDPNGLQQVFLNLLTNAVDAMADLPERQRRIRIATSGHDGRVRVEIADSGQGIPEEIRQRVFDPFFTTKGEDKGTGLGLAITSSIVHKHRGEIRLESRTGQGTNFILIFPAAGSPEAPKDSLDSLPEGTILIG